MTNLSTASFEELQTLEAKLELTNRIHIRSRLNQLLLNPNADFSDILALTKLLAKMVDQSLQQQKQDHATVKAQSRDRELALAESKVEVQRESLAIARLKLETKKSPPPNVEEIESKPLSSNPSNIIVPPHLALNELRSVNAGREELRQSRAGA